ncbi:MAG: hypothetical protein LQ343_004105 [Gyalolechia ehrenbergii]|nr:MAG: hypothetical protein LQ343_004105 [Gyalolechia ehrenbergii]
MSVPPRGGSGNSAISPPPTSPTQSPRFQYDLHSRAVHSGRRASTASSVTSIGGALDSAHDASSPIPELGNNAISTLLQPPILRSGLYPNTPTSSGFKLPSTRDIPPVTLTNIPHVEPSVFRPYLNQAGSLYDAFQRAKESNSNADYRRPRASSKGRGPPPSPTTEPSRRQGSESSSSHADTISHTLDSPTLDSPPKRPQAARKASGGTGRRAPLAVAPLSTIPSVYFEPDFHLENPRTFDIVSERSEIAPPPSSANGSAIAPGSGRKALASNAILQEKLSWYMDTVEMHLISSISTASTSFFAALGSLRELHLEASESVAKIKRLRDDLARLDKNMAMGGLKVAAMRRRRENMRKLGNAVQQLRDVVDTVAHCEEQVEQGDIENALKGLAAAERLIAGERDAPTGQRHDRENLPALIDLRGIKALESADGDIALLRRRIGKGFETRFLQALLGDLRKHVDSVPAVVTFQRWDKASQRSRGHHDRTPSAFPAYLQMDDSVRSALRSSLEGLAQAGSIMPAAMAFREAVLREVKALIKRPLPSSNEDDAESTMSASTQDGRQRSQQEKSSILARNLRALDSDDAENMLKQMYSNVGEALRRLGTQVKVLLDVTSSFASRPVPSGVKSPLSPPTSVRDSYMGTPTANITIQAPVQQEEIQQVLDMSSLLGQAVDIAQSQITKVLKARSEQSTHLPLPQFLRYFNLNRMFADECEAVSGRSGQALKTIVNTHIKDFVSQFGESLMQQLVQRMDTDRWEAKDFANHDSQVLDRILEASTKEIDSWTRACIVWERTKEEDNDEVQTNGEIHGENNQMNAQRDKTRSAEIDEQKYILTDSTLLVLQAIEQFESLITGIPSMTQEITTILLEYLRLFNSRCQQLVLGAGATKIAGLKNITTKHLALSSQALSFITALIPHIREFVRRHSSGSGQLMIEFDKVRRLYQEHQYGVHDKFVEIMSGRASAHVSSLRKINWDAVGKDAQAVNPYMEILIKETLTLHKVLSKFLPEMTISMIMNPVFNSYRDQLSKGFQDSEVKTGAGKSRMIHDIEFLQSRMSKLEGSGELSQYLLQVVNGKPVAQQLEKKQEEAEVKSITDTTLANGRPAEEHSDEKS